MYISKKIKIHLGLVVGRIVNGHLHQQSFVFHHNVSSKGQYRYPTCFNIFQNPCPFHKLCKLQVPLWAFVNIVVQGLKQPFNYAHYLQVWQSLNKVGFMNHIMNPHGMWTPTIKKLLGNTWLSALENKNPIGTKCH
jgi:hypothetical protein